ncbi:MAG: hypothetical protein HC860_05375 [Alkalinema sp. RU_4_3]|nr:hypothetical protein [Alkalinema sp. RU_4_3]
MPISKLAWVASATAALIPWGCSLSEAKNAQANSGAAAFGATALLSEGPPQTIALGDPRILVALSDPQPSLANDSQGAFPHDAQAPSDATPGLLKSNNGILLTLASPLAEDLLEQDLVERNLRSLRSLVSMWPGLGDGSEGIVLDQDAQSLPILGPIKGFFQTLSAAKSFFPTVWGHPEGMDGFSQTQRRENISQIIICKPLAGNVRYQWINPGASPAVVFPRFGCGAV